MIFNYPYLKDDNFLKAVDKLSIKEQYVKITVLDWQEEPIKEVQGVVSNGNLNLNGSSAVRRTGSISVVISKDYYDITEVNNLFSLNKKIALEIGIKNYVYDYEQYAEYDIIWFPLGIFVIAQPSVTNNQQGINISLSLKDKMCLLNGEFGGTFPASVTFDKVEELDENNNIIIKKVPLYRLIKEMLTELGNEQLNKILIEDLDSRIKMVMKWVGSDSAYYKIVTKNNISSIDFHSGTIPSEPEANTTYIFVGFEDDVGYIYSDFCYTSDLIGNIGDNVCSILDNIVKFLGNYEYFYDIYGNFIFREKKNYLNTSKSTVVIKNLNYLTDYTNSKSIYNFDDTTLISSFSMTPKYSQIKNDFLVWGIRQSLSGAKIPIRYHLAIDKKPRAGNTYWCKWDKDGRIIAISSVETTEYNKVITQNWQTELYFQGKLKADGSSQPNYYYAELDSEWYKLYKLGKEKDQDYYIDQLIDNIYDIDYYLDFIDSPSVSNISISSIGRRTKAVNSNEVNCIFPKAIPNYIIIKAGQEDTQNKVNEAIARGEEYIQVSTSMYEALAIGGTRYSAYDYMRDLLYQYTNYNTSISISCLPIYHLEPNTRIIVRDPVSGINGDYIINSLSLPLGISGTSSISCSQALERI